MKGLAVHRRDFIVFAAGAGCAGGMAFAAAAAAGHTILVVGDSLSAEYGLARGAGWVALMEKRLAERKVDAKVVNASISGDTTAGGRSRIVPLLTQFKPDIVVIELGGNDALRGLPLQSSEDNLVQMAKTAQAAGAQVLIIGIQVPPNYGTDYMRKFSGVFEKAAAATNSAVVPFFLRGVADGADAEAMFQPDRIHPVAAAHPKMLENVWPELSRLLRLKA